MKGESFYDNGHDPPLYRHDVVLSDGPTTANCSLNLTIFNSIETAFTMDSLFSGMVNKFPCYGYLVISDSVYFVSVIDIKSHSSSNILGLFTGVQLLSKGSDGAASFPSGAYSSTITINNPIIYDKVTKIL